MNNRKAYLIISVLLILVEVVIETQFKTGFIRFYFGDYLMVIGIYTVIKTIKPSCNSLALAFSVLVFSFSVEILQSINIIKMLGYQRSRLTDIVLGSTFSIGDLICYTLG
ncbi:DUF2809 domain-containing protein, partial [Flavobacteriaceae bacterium]|nr:DUF2809 domain-containing protein [Flavobacteriaceae bacterium]